MKKLTSSLLLVVFFFSLLPIRNAHAEIPVKARAFITMAAYGAGGGALVGAASLAFGATGRAVAQGASLGLYAGILFGTYVLVAHHNRRQGYYDDNSSPYRQSSDIYGDGYQSDEGGSSSGDDSKSGFFDRIQSMHVKLGQKKGAHVPPLYLNIFQYHF
jgi:hypothetical protein